MDALHWVFLALAVASLAGAVVLLIQRGAMSARAAASDAAAQHARASLERLEQTGATLTAELATVRQALADAEKRVTDLTGQLAALEKAREAALAHETSKWQAKVSETEQVYRARFDALEDEKRKLEASLTDLTAKMKDAFDALASKALESTTKQFLTLASQQFERHAGEASTDLDKRQKAVEALVQPIRETLAKTEAALASMQKERVAGEADIKARLEENSRVGRLLREETSQLVRALREPQVRGRYGEIQLRRVAEIAGMRAYCDFVEQHATLDADGNALRPDMVINLPNGRQVVVDAKANLQPYLDAAAADSLDEAEAHLERFADGIEAAAIALAKKTYWKHYDGSAEFVVMFVPAERFLDEALARRPDLLERTAARGVILAGPGSLIALLRAVHVGFQERLLSEKAREMGDLVAELHKRLTIMLEHAEGLGSALGTAVTRWNNLAGSVSGRLLPQIRAIEAVGVRPEKPVPEPPTIDTTLRELPRLPRQAEGTP